MTKQHRRYILIETAISVAINALISAGFAWLVFHGRGLVTPFGPGGFALDFLPQTFMIALMGSAIPTLIAHRRLKAGAVPSRQASRRALPQHPLLRALILAVSAAVVLGATAIAVSNAIPPLSFTQLLAIKIVYGAGVAVIVTPLALYCSLADERLAAEPAKG